ncbi:MAG: hypothetical protein JWQ16_2638 [Novosphingobium sp.]|nr:hypothetical protein [Novosphingobium sp.]
MTEDRSDERAASSAVVPGGSAPSRRWTSNGLRGVTFAAVSLVGGVVAIVMMRGADQATPRFRAIDAVASAPQPAGDPLMPELVRCRGLPPEVMDQSCQRTWDENRRRFFGEAPEAGAPGAPLPQRAPPLLSPTMPTVAPLTFPPPAEARTN